MSDNITQNYEKLRAEDIEMMKRYVLDKFNNFNPFDSINIIEDVSSSYPLLVQILDEYREEYLFIVACFFSIEP